MTAARFRFATCWLSGAVALALLAGTPAFAQQAGGNQGQSPAQQPEAARIPATVLSGLLTGTPESLLALRQYLAAVGASPDEVSTRALQVVQQLRDSGLVRDPALILAAAERVTQAVTETLESTKVLQLKVDRTFRPPPGALALDFAPADAEEREGFRRVLPTDPIVRGQGLQGIRRPGEDDVLAGGIVGVESLEIDLPDGEYRVTLMTEAIGDAALSLAPFGQTIVANGQAIRIGQATPEHWLSQAVLSNQGLQGFENASTREGGAVTFTVTVSGGKLNLGFDLGTTGEVLKTYLTGMLIEPASMPPALTPIPEVRSLLAAPVDRGQFENQMASSIATLLEEVVPGAGGPEDDLSRPVQTVQQASPN